MRTRARNVAAALPVALLATALLTIAARHTSQPDLHVPAAHAIPAGAVLVVTARGDALRDPAVADALAHVGFASRDVLSGVCSFDVLASLDEAAIATPGSSLEGELGAVLSGSFRGDAMGTCVARAIERRGGRPETVVHGATRTVVDLASDGATIAATRDGMLLFGGASYVARMLAALDGTIDDVLADPRHRSLRRDLDANASVVVSVRVTADTRERIRRELGAASSPATSLLGLGASIRLGDELVVNGVLACDAEAPCVDLAATLERLKKAGEDDAFAHLLGLSTALAGVHVAARGATVRVDASLPRASAGRLVDAWQSLR